MTPLQLAFDLPGRQGYRREDFFPSCANRTALAAIDDWENWPGGKMLLIGPEGSGKTHLAHLWADDTGAARIQGHALPFADLPYLAASGAVVVEDAEAVAGNREAEVALFHLHNLIVPAGVPSPGRLLLTASSPARDWGIKLPDLRSRMDATPVAKIDPPDDALLAAVLVKLFNDRQTIVAPTLIPWLVARMERSISAARALVAAMDARALAVGGPITRATARDLLELHAVE